MGTSGDGELKLYSERQRDAATAGQPEVYIYDNLPMEFRRQVIYIWRKALPYWSGREIHYQMNWLWKAVEDIFTLEKGIDSINKKWTDNRYENYLLNASVEDALDLIELTFRVIYVLVGKMEDWKRSNANIVLAPENAIAEVNRRFRQHNLGYQIADGSLVRADSQYLHEHAVLPALTLLQDARFAGAEQEFRRAHHHYCDGRNKEAIVEAAKAFESTMKAISKERGIAIAGHENAKQLIDLMLKNDVIPQYLQSEFAGLRQVLESGLPTVRNKTSGHGQGPQPVEVPNYIVAYALNTAAANIILLVEAFNRMS